MLDKDPALRQMIKNANLELNLPENFIKLVPKVELTDNVIEVEVILYSNQLIYLHAQKSIGETKMGKYKFLK